MSRPPPVERARDAVVRAAKRWRVIHNLRPREYENGVVGGSVVDERFACAVDRLRRAEAKERAAANGRKR